LTLTRNCIDNKCVNRKLRNLGRKGEALFYELLCSLLDVENSGIKIHSIFVYN
jgi:hypothetical protein